MRISPQRVGGPRQQEMPAMSKCDSGCRPLARACVGNTKMPRSSVYSVSVSPRLRGKLFNHRARKGQFCQPTTEWEILTAVFRLAEANPLAHACVGNTILLEEVRVMIPVSPHLRGKYEILGAVDLATPHQPTLAWETRLFGGSR